MANLDAVVLDTDVFGALFIDRRRAERAGKPLDQWTAAVTGVPVLISFQTRAEVLAGLLGSGWGSRRIEQARTSLDRARTIPADHAVIGAFAELTATCRAHGHALHAKIHTGDRWVAASAIAKGIPLLSGDAIFRDAPGLTLL